ncbi:MAG: ABC transporter permease [Parcubacteria group bacterium]
MKQHENYKELIWMLAKTDFKLRYQGSFLGYVWAVLQPLLLFLVLNFVFSGVFGGGAKGGGEPFYSLQLLVAIMLYTFFSEGTSAGLNALKSKSALVTKIYVPRWAIIIASTIQSFMVFAANILVIIVFFAWYHFIPSLYSFGLFIFFAFVMYFVILGFSLIVAPALLYFRDLQMIWQVALRVMFYATPILYPLTMLPAWTHKIILLNPVAFIIHFTKESMFKDRFADAWQYTTFIGLVAIFLFFSIWAYRKLIVNVAEKV